jgi:hypothetical protein
LSGSLAAERQRLPRALTHREQILDELLDHYTEAQETLSSRGGPGAAGEGLALMPKVWNDSYRELERALIRMKGLSDPNELASLGFHLGYTAIRLWYLECEKYPQLPKKRKVQRGREIVEVQDAPRWRIVRRASPGMVLRGLVWVAAEFVGEPYIPKEILEPVAA